MTKLVAHLVCIVHSVLYWCSAYLSSEPFLMLLRPCGFPHPTPLPVNRKAVYIQRFQSQLPSGSVQPLGRTERNLLAWADSTAKTYFRCCCYLFTFGCVESSLLCEGFSLVVVGGGYSLASVHGLLVVASLMVQGLQGTQASAVAACGLSSCGSWALEHRLKSCGVWTWFLCSMWDLAGPSWIFLDQTHVSCIGRWILCH